CPKEPRAGVASGVCAPGACGETPPRSSLGTGRPAGGAEDFIPLTRNTVADKMRIKNTEPKMMTLRERFGLGDPVAEPADEPVAAAEPVGGLPNEPVVGEGDAEVIGCGPRSAGEGSGGAPN